MLTFGPNPRSLPGTELFGEEERKEIVDVLDTGVLFRFNHDAARKGHWKARDLEQERPASPGPSMPWP
ncbi:MAG: hypothetical protein R2810_04685 [Flavobacteriales bacterium]